MFFRSKKNNNKKALLIGINYRGTLGELYGCINDIRNIKKMLLKKGYNSKNIRILSEDSKLLPTKKNIGQGLLWLLENKENKPLDVFFHYSGHGSWVYDKNNDEIDNRDECLVPLDYKKSGMIYDDDLRNILCKYLTSNTNLFALVDSCHSGTMFDLRFNATCKTIKKIDNEYVTDFNIETHNYKDIIKGNVYALSGCEDKQTSADAFIDRQSQGALTYSFIKTLKNNKDLTYEKFMSNIFHNIKSNNFEQSPTFSSNRSIVFENKINF